jgi:hypothetical protein
MMTRQSAVLLLSLVLAMMGRAQSAMFAPGPSTNALYVEVNSSGSDYIAPSRSAMFHNFLLDSAGPYPIAMGLATAAIHQATDNPPEWQQGAAGLSRRFGSNLGVTAVGNATRFGLGELLNNDTSFYRCRCRGAWPRLQHAVLSALIARKRSNGDPVFSVPGLVAPYAATLTAVYAWYPARYGAKDAFRMGNYTLLGTVGGNLTFEFMPDRVRKALGRMHLNNRRVAAQP